MLTKIGKHYLDTASITYAIRGEQDRLGVWLGGSDRPIVFDVGPDADAIEAELERMAGGGGPTDKEAAMLRLLGRIVDAYDNGPWHAKGGPLLEVARRMLKDNEWTAP